MDDLKKAIEMAKIACKAIDDKQGEEIKVIDISGISTLADYFIIAHGKNKPHIQSIVEQVEFELEKEGYAASHTEGKQTARWVLLDYANIIVHVFDKEDRFFYDLERIWADGKEVNINEL